MYRFWLWLWNKILILRATEISKLKFSEGSSGKRGIRGVLKTHAKFCIVSKFIYLFMFYFVPFKVILMRYYTLHPRFLPIFEALEKIFFFSFCRLYLINRRVESCSHVPFQFRAKKKLQRPYGGNTKNTASLVCCF